jgi:hypothetical protein
VTFFKASSLAVFAMCGVAVLACDGSELCRTGIWTVPSCIYEGQSGIGACP